MERLIGGILLILSLVLFPPRNPTPAYADLPGLRWTAADLIPLDSEVSLYRYSAFGTGIFPYDSRVPNRTVPVLVDGVPVPPVSPFGSDLEHIPALLTDSLSIIDSRLIRIATLDSIPLRPQTRIGFLTGDRRRSRFEGVFHRKITDNSAILVGGRSDGIRGNEITPGNLLRLYNVKYIHALTEKSLAAATISGFRDRQDLFNLDTGNPLGKRVMDTVQFSGELKRYPLSKRTALSAAAYYRNGVSRFTRTGVGSNFDDNGYGLNATLSSTRTNARYTLDAWSDSRLFEGRRSEATWKGNTSGVRGSGAWDFSSLHLDLDGGGLYSSKYGAGLVAGAGMFLPVFGKATGILRADFSHGFPGPETVFYPTLLFSDTLNASNPGRFQTAELEAGIRGRWGATDVGLYAFSARSDAPYFIPVPASMIMNGNAWYSGARLTLAAQGGTAVFREGRMRLEYIGSSSPRRIWPRPDLNIQARGSLSRYYFKRNLHASLYGETRISDWRSGPLTPEGVHFFLDSGVSLQISSFTVFYQAENITNTDMRWFDAFRWQGRNYQWGVFWSLRD